MTRNVPFYPNTPDGMHCVQAAFGSMLEYFLHHSFSYDELDRLTHRVGSGGTWWFPALTEFHQLGLDTLMISTFDYDKFYREGEPYLRRVYPQEVVNWYIDKSNLLAVKSFIPDYLQSSHLETRAASMDDIDRLLTAGWLVGVDLNSRTLNGREGFSSHMVTIFDSSKQSLTLHDPGLPPHPNRKVSKDTFLEAWSYTGPESLSLVAVRKQG